MIKRFLLIIFILAYTPLKSALAESTPDDQLALKYYHQAEILFLSKKYNEALEWYNKALQHRKQDGPIVIEERTVVKSTPKGRKVEQEIVNDVIREDYIPNQRIQSINDIFQEQILAANPPMLELRWITLREPTRDDVLDGGEKGSIILALKNTGRSDARNISIKVDTDDPQGLEFDRTYGIGNIPAGEEKSFAIDLLAKRDTLDKTRQFAITALEANGFDSNKLDVTLRTRPHRPAKITADIVSVSDFTNDSRIEPTEVVTVTARVRNIGDGISHHLSAAIKLGDNILLGPDSPTSIDIGQLVPNDDRKVSFSFLTNNRVTHEQPLAVAVDVFENNVKILSLDSLDLVAYVSQSTTAINVMPVPRSPPKDTEQLDFELLKLNKINKHGIAVVIGNKDYLFRGTPTVKYAVNDAQLVKAYLMITMGYQESNILYYENATAAVFNTIFGSAGNYAGKLYDYVTPKSSDVFIYYSGHGAPDQNSKSGFILPVDFDPNYIEHSSYSMDTFFDNVNKIPARSVTIVLDTCFSGNSAGGALLNNISASPIPYKSKPLKTTGAAIFVSAAPDQVSSWYDEKKHGLYTYYFFKGVGSAAADLDDNGIITTTELGEYTKSNVIPKARQISGLDQFPLLTQKHEFVLLEYRGNNTAISKQTP